MVSVYGQCVELSLAVLAYRMVLHARRRSPVAAAVWARQGLVRRSNDEAMARLDEFRREGGAPDGAAGPGGEWMLHKVEAGGQRESSELLGYEKRMMAHTSKEELKEMEASVMHADVKDA